MRSSLRTFLQTVPGIELVGQGGNEAEVMDGLRANHPGLVVLDADLTVMKSWSLTEFINQVKKEYPVLRLIVLANNRPQIQVSFSAGAVALLKGNLDESLRAAILAGNDPGQMAV